MTVTLITKETLAYHRVLWFAHDNQGNIIMADSCEGDVPSFVKNSLENTEYLAQALCGMRAVTHTGEASIDYCQWADWGFYCFRSDDYDGSVYHLCATPTAPIRLDDLDPAVKQMLSTQKIPVNIDKCQQFGIGHKDNITYFVV